MECISELKDSLNVYFGWNKARMACFVKWKINLIEQNNPQWLDLGLGLF